VKTKKTRRPGKAGEGGRKTLRTESRPCGPRVTAGPIRHIKRGGEEVRQVRQKYEESKLRRMLAAWQITKKKKEEQEKKRHLECTQVEDPSLGRGGIDKREEMEVTGG